MRFHWCGLSGYIERPCCRTMRENRHKNEVVQRGGGRIADNDKVEAQYGGGFEKRSLRLRRWLIFILVCLSASLIAINSFTARQINIACCNHAIVTQEHSIPTVEPAPPTPAPGYLVQTKGCRIPALDMLDPAIRSYVYKEKPLHCETGDHLPLVDSNQTAVYVNPKARSHFYADSETVQCCWRAFWRNENEDNTVTYGKDCHKFEDSANVSAEFVKVECTKGGAEIYRDYYAFVPRKPEVEKRCQNATRRNSSSPPLSILILGIDAVSRLNFHRTMPKTIETLRSLDVVEMLGYNKVADNTFPNVVPILSGVSEKELRKECWHTSKESFDLCPFLWKNFSSAGYRTVFGEDACSMTIFNYLRAGFRQQPTDYYLRPFCVTSENDIGNTHKLNANLCVGTRKTFENLLGYARKVATEFTNDTYFAFFWQASLTHDFLNYPQLGDNSYSAFVRSLKEAKLLNNTALIVLSDHGIRWGGIRQTYQGRLEESLPFVFIALPTWWRETFPTAWTNLRRNARSLTTPFDLHETLQDILRPDALQEDALRSRIRALSSGSLPRGLSWFLPVPDHRSCSMADIPGHWCMCHSSSNASLTDKVVLDAVEFLVAEINEMVKPYPQCARLKLKSLLNAKMWAHKAQSQDKTAPMVDYTVTIETQPGDAVFEASVRHRTDDSKKKLIGSISRLNLYGKQSACVDNFNMRLYCYCR